MMKGNTVALPIGLVVRLHVLCIITGHPTVASEIHDAVGDCLITHQPSLVDTTQHRAAFAPEKKGKKKSKKEKEAQKKREKKLSKLKKTILSE